jgi:hypothetical protein
MALSAAVSRSFNWLLTVLLYAQNLSRLRYEWWREQPMHAYRLREAACCYMVQNDFISLLNKISLYGFDCAVYFKTTFGFQLKKEFRDSFMRVAF